MPTNDKMQALEWRKLWREIIGALYGVTAVFTGVMESGKTGQNPRMQIDVNNNTTEFYQHKLEDVWNKFVFPKFGVSDWLLKCNPVEEKDEMQDTAVLQAKVNLVASAAAAGFDAELTDEGEVRVSGKPFTLEEKMMQQQAVLGTRGEGKPDGKPAEDGKPTGKQEEGDKGFKHRKGCCESPVYSDGVRNKMSKKTPLEAYQAFCSTKPTEFDAFMRRWNEEHPAPLPKEVPEENLSPNTVTEPAEPIRIAKPRSKRSKPQTEENPFE
jgi:hypothetical protein